MHWFCYRLTQSRLLAKSVTMFPVMRGSVSHPVGRASFCLRLHRTAPDKPIILLFTFVFKGAYLIPVLFFPPCSGLCRLMSSEIISIKRVTCHSDGSRWWFGTWNLWQQLSGPNRQRNSFQSSPLCVISLRQSPQPLDATGAVLPLPFLFRLLCFTPSHMSPHFN